MRALWRRNDGFHSHPASRNCGGQPGWLPGGGAAAYRQRWAGLGRRRLKEVGWGDLRVQECWHENIYGARTEIVQEFRPSIHSFMTATFWWMRNSYRNRPNCHYSPSMIPVHCGRAPLQNQGSFNTPRPNFSRYLRISKPRFQNH